MCARGRRLPPPPLPTPLILSLSLSFDAAVASQRTRSKSGAERRTPRRWRRSAPVTGGLGGRPGGAAAGQYQSGFSDGS